MSSIRPRIIVSAFACHPSPEVGHFPGEAILGWSLVKEIRKFADIHVLTWEANREGIQHYSLDSCVFHYIDLPPQFWRILGPRYLGVRFYYFLWQLKAARFARRLAGRESFSLSHQITFSNDWMPSFMGSTLNLPFIWGPVGGGQRVPSALMNVLGAEERRQEKMRNFFQAVWRKTSWRRKTADAASKILVCNRETKEFFKLWTHKLVDFPVNGINSVDDSHDLHPRASAEVFSVIYAGRFDGIKGLGLAFEAFSRFLRNCPNARFTLVGEGPEKRKLAFQARQLRLEDRIEFVPWQKREALFDLMKRSHVLLFPSMRDGGGAVVVEAMSAGLPTICLDIGGPGFHIASEWGVKIRPAEPEQVIGEMAASLAMIYNDENLRLNLGRKAKQQAKYYLWSNQGERLKEIYREALKK